MSTLYNIEITEDGSFQFITANNHVYLIYFLQTFVPDKDGNIHTFLNFGFSRDGDHSCVSFANKYDGKISDTIINFINDVFAKHDHRVLIYFCFDEDGYSRHRKITFNKWKKVLNHSIESHDAAIKYEEAELFSCLMLHNENPLKGLILEAFEAYLKDFE